MNIAIITGASAGLGREYFRAAVKRYKFDEIWLIARRAERLKALSDEYPDVKVRILELDLTKNEAYDALEKTLEEQKPVVKLLINCAGVGNFGDISKSAVKTEVNMVDVNVRGLVAVTTAAVKYMCSDSKILNVSSIAGFAPTPRMTVYSCTKIFVLNYSRSLRQELAGTGVKVLAVCPGPMKTEFLDVANIVGKSKKFDSMPGCDPKAVAEFSLSKLDSGSAVYTPRFPLKLYRVAAAVLPRGLFVKLSDLK